MPRSPVTTALTVLAAALLLPLIALVMFETLIQRSLYPAPSVPVPESPPPPLREVVLEPRDGLRVPAWTYRPGDAAPGRPVALFFHGNGENLATMHRAGLFDELRRLDVPFLAADYPGYGRATGEPSESTLVATAEAALERAGKEHPGRPVVAAGWSLGAAVAVQLAHRHEGEVDGLVLLSAWTDLAEVAAVHFPGPLVRPLLSDRYDSLAAAPGLALPALVMHGRADRVIPCAQGERLAGELAGPVRWVPVEGAGHNDLLARQGVWEELRRFLDGIARDEGIAERGPEPGAGGDERP